MKMLDFASSTEVLSSDCIPYLVPLIYVIKRGGKAQHAPRDRHAKPSINEELGAMKGAQRLPEAPQKASVPGGVYELSCAV